MKKSIFFFIIILFSCSLFSNTVKISKAKQISISWMSERTGSDYGLSDIGEVIVNSEGKDTLYYVINFINGGWVLVAADERVYPVIGYSLKNQYTLNNIPPAHEEWMDKVMRSVKKLKMLNAKANEFIVNAWDYYGDENFRPSLFKSGVPVIGPLVQTTWDQDYPYNKFCPVDSSASDNHAKTGCVAVAMAQVMKYYNHPSSGMDSISYTPSSHPEYGVQKIVFSGQSYNWTSMSEDDIAK